MPFWLSLGAKIVYRKKIKEMKRRHPHMSSNQALMKIMDEEAAKQMETMKRKAFSLNIVMALSGLFIVFAIALVIASMIFFSNTMAAFAGNTMSILLEDPKKAGDDAKKDGWKWEKKDGAKKANNGSGGLYPKDPQLRLRAELLEMLTKSCADAESNGLNHIEPAWVLGEMGRETQNAIWSVMSSSNISSLYTELLTHNPSCVKDLGGMRCGYNSAGISHYYGGSYDGEDKGDPYTQVANTSESNYKAAGGDHAMGYWQFENPFIYAPDAEFFRSYGNPAAVTSSNDAATAQSEAQKDATLGFIRPNIMYIPDEAYNVSFYFANKPANSKESVYAPFFASGEFTSLSSYNQGCIRVILNTAAYGRGHLESSDIAVAQEIIAAVNSGAVKNIDDMLSDVAGSYWDNDGMKWCADEDKFVSYIKSTYGIDLTSKQDFKAHGLYSICLGKLAYDGLKAKIDAAEKDGPTTAGNAAGQDGIIAYASKWLGHPYVWGGHGEVITEDVLTIKRRINGYNENFLDFQRSFIGKKDANGEDYRAFDCSGFVQYIYKEYAKTDITGITYTQINDGSPVDPTDESAFKVGDLILFGKDPAKPGHVGMYIGGGNFIEAPKTGDVVKISPLSSRSDRCVVRRILDTIP